MAWVYRDRAQAGTMLADLLVGYADRDRITVLALPRGGVPVAAPMARALKAPLDILAVCKLGVPGHEELAMGALAEGGVRVINADVVAALGISEAMLDAAAAATVGRLADQETRFRGARTPMPQAGRCIVLVDDGLATGATMEAAIVSCRQAGAAWITVAVPIGPPATVARLATLADDIICPLQPASFRAVGLAYADFSPVADSEVVALLARARSEGTTAPEI